MHVRTHTHIRTHAQDVITVTLNFSSALCGEPCVSGSCIAPNTCNCTEGWSGRLCDQRKCHI